MKYKPGDKVKIKTWEKMEKEYRTNKYGDIECFPYFFGINKEKSINKDFPNRILTIAIVNNRFSFYKMKELNGYQWTDDMIECLASDYKKPISIRTRFEILDL